MNYEKIYESIITRAKTRPRPDCYTEKHHIIPRCMGGGDEIENIAVLTPEEHYVVHQLLVKIHPHVSGLITAAFLMCSNSKNHQRSNNKIYGWLRRRAMIELRTSITRECRVCNKSFSIWPYILIVAPNSGNCCSKSCSNRYRKGTMKSKKQECTCLYCDNTFLILPSRIKLGEGKFCSRYCSNNYFRRKKSNN